MPLSNGGCHSSFSARLLSLRWGPAPARPSLGMQPGDLLAFLGLTVWWERKCKMLSK